MKTFPKILALVLVAVMSLALLGGIAAGDSSTEGVKLSLWIIFPSNAAMLMQSFEDNFAWQKMQADTGIDIEFQSPPIGQEAEQLQLILSSGNYPDMIQFNAYAGSATYPGGAVKAVEDGVYLRLNELIAEHAPNFTNVIESDIRFKQQIMTDDGLIWGMGMLETDPQTCYQGPVVRQDWMDDLGLEAPVTIEDWYNVLTTFRDEKDAKSPWFMPASGKAECFMWAYDLAPGGPTGEWLQRDGKVVYSYADPGYLEYLTEMNKWYNEGLFLKDFTTGDYVRQNQELTEGNVGAYYQGFWMFTIDETMVHEKDPNFVAMPVTIPIKDADSTTKIRILEPNYRGFDTVITGSCENPVAAMKFLDYGYSDEMYMASNYGTLGKTYNMVDGKPVFTDYMLNNPDGFDLNQLMNMECQQAGSFVRDWACYFVGYSPAANLTLTLWDGSTEHLMLERLLSFTAVEGGLNATLMSDIKTYVDEMIVKFIKGEEPLSNWDSYLNTIYGMGLAEVEANYQAAYDRYLQRGK